MRLIDADVIIKALDEALEDARNDGIDLMDVLKMELFKNFMKQIISYTPTVDTDGLNAAHEDIGYEKGYRDGYAEALYETDKAEPMPAIESTITYEQVKEYCRRRCLVIITAETFNEMNAILDLLQPDDYEEGEQK